MNNIVIKCSPESLKAEGEKVLITAEIENEEEILYKFMIGYEGKWNVLREFAQENTLEWIPENCGNYMIMVQGKVKDSKKPYNYVSKVNYTVGAGEKELISEVNFENEKHVVGQKQAIIINTITGPLLYRCWIKNEDNWELLKDYSEENRIEFTAKSAGKHELLVECKELDSQNNFDDFRNIDFEVVESKKVEINNFKNLTGEMLTDSEMIFEVDATCDDCRTILYKFLKINSKGKITCIQDYSTKKVVSYVEDISGEYKLLCLAKEVNSANNYDDRALINFTVKPYKDIHIKSFISDVNPPQICEAPVELKAIVSGGKTILYRYIIRGPEEEDSGYLKSNSFIWHSKKPGRYAIELWVRDESSDKDYEDKKTMEFVIDEFVDTPVHINEIILDRKTKLLLNETINVKAIATGGIELRYAFSVLKNRREVEYVEYGTCNWVNFTPEEPGVYEIEVKVKSKFSNREFDNRSIVTVEAYEFIPAEIDYVLMDEDKKYVVGERVELTMVARNTNNLVFNYLLRINGHDTEETGYVKNSRYSFLPRCGGYYTIEVKCKNIDSTKDYDSKRDIRVKIHEVLPIINVGINSDVTEFYRNEPINFTAFCEGGKEVMFEFYLMEQGEWNLVQKYSRKNYYTFMPFNSGKYKVLALLKSNLKQSEYEAYKEYDFEVKERTL